MLSNILQHTIFSIHNLNSDSEDKPKAVDNTADAAKAVDNAADAGKIIIKNADDVIEGAGKYTGKPYSGTRNPDVDFSNSKGKSTLKTHFDDHAGDFGYKTEAEYLSGTRNFLEKPPTPTTQSFVTKDGTYFRYDTATNEFGIMNKYGGSSSYFKPDKGIDYWLEQINLYAPKE